MYKMKINENKHELAEELKDLTAALVAQDTDKTKKNKAPKNITIVLPYNLFGVLKATVLTALFDVSDALEDKDKQYSLAKELASKAYLFSFANYDWDLYKTLLNTAGKKSNKGGETDGR